MTKAVEEVYSALRQRFKGALLRPDDDEFDRAQSIWNGMVTRTPGLIACCTDVPDVQLAVRAAAQAAALTAVRCGGHSLAGFGSCDNGLVMDLSGMREVIVDERNRRARFSGGCLLRTIDSSTQSAGLAFPAGVVSHTGAAGLVLGGGTGWLNRLHGLSCDNVEGFTVVIANGSVLRVNDRENPDLFWALRGGGGNFGVVTEFQVRLHPVTSVLFGAGMCVGDDIARILEHWRDFMPQAPDNLRWGISLTIAPEREDVPSKVRGRPVASGAALWVGDLDEGRRHVDHAISLCSPVAVTKKVISFLELQTMADSEFPRGRRYYTKSGYFKSLDHGTITAMVEALSTTPSPTNQIELAYLGGAAARVGAGETAFGDRSSPFIANLLGNWSDPVHDDANRTWIRNLFAKLRPAMAPGVYVNFMSGDEQDRVAEAYRERWERLVAIKTLYDPANFFSLNQNIRPQNATKQT
jgi:hypothetical protein